MGFRMASITKSYQVRGMAVSLVVINMMYGKFSFLFSLTTKLTSVVVSLPDALFETWGEALISGIDKLTIHTKFLGATSRAKTFSAMVRCFIGLTAILASADHIVSTGLTFTCERTIRFIVLTLIGYKPFTANRTSLVLNSRMGRTPVRAVSLVLRITSYKLPTAMFAVSNLLSLLSDVLATPRAKTAHTALKIKAVCLKFNPAYFTSVEYGWLLFGSCNTSAGTKFLAKVGNFKRCPALGTNSSGHSNSPYLSYWPYMMSWGAGYREASCQVSS